ncbi:MAG TPA: AAA family ATPase, partial [Ktedonobacteraceae bacterium]
RDIQLGHTIYIVEGEPKVIKMRTWGFAATCAPEGAGKWYPEHAELLRGARQVVIMPDNDEPGRRHADLVGRSLEGIVPSVCLLELPNLPDHGDICDWEGTLEQFKELTPREWEPYYKEDDADLGVINAGDLLATKPAPRGWLLGNIFARKFLSSLFGDGGVGKTALRYAELLSLAIGRSLTGDHVFQRCRVLIISLEDDIEELHRRLEALMLHYKIELDEVRDWLFVCAPGARKGKLMTVDNRGRVKEGKLAGMIEAEIVEHNVDIVCIDPFVKTHAVEENANMMIDEVAQVLVDLMYKHDIAIDAPHHISKGTGEPGNANRGRGASSMKDAARLVFTLTPMSEKEGTTYKIPEELRRRLVRMDSGKVNITPPMHLAKWYELIGVKLGNSTELYPNGDEVQAIRQWTPPNTYIDDSTTERILADIQAGLPDGNRYSSAPNSEERAAWKVVVKHEPAKSEGQAREIIKTWIKEGVLVSQEYPNPKTRKPAQGLIVAAQQKSEEQGEIPF